MISLQVIGGTGWGLLASSCAGVIGQAAGGGEVQADAARRLVALLLIVVLLLVVLFTGFFLVRSLQRARQRLLRERATPTESSDVWSTHRLPEDPAESTDDEPES